MSTEMITCPTCGAEMPSNARFCPDCGASNVTSQPAEQVTPVPPAEPEAAVQSEESVAADPAVPAEPAAEAEPASQPEPASATTDFSTPMAPPSFYEPIAPSEEAPPAETAPTPDESQGSPTVNVGTGAEVAAAGAAGEEGSPTVNLGSAPDFARYTPPAAAAAYQAGSQPAQQTQPQYTPPPTAQAYGGTENFQQYTPPSQPVQPYSNTPPVTNYQYQSAPGVAGTYMRDPTVALLLELLGYVFFLGIGHMYGGRVGRGIGILVVWWLYWGIVTVLALSMIGIPIACVMAILWPFVPILSGFWIRSDLLKDNTTGRRY